MCIRDRVYSRNWIRWFYKESCCFQSNNYWKKARKKRTLKSCTSLYLWRTHPRPKFMAIKVRYQKQAEARSTSWSATERVRRVPRYSRRDSESYHWPIRSQRFKFGGYPNRTINRSILDTAIYSSCRCCCGSRCSVKSFSNCESWVRHTLCYRNPRCCIKNHRWCNHQHQWQHRNRNYRWVTRINLRLKIYTFSSYWWSNINSWRCGE